MCIESIFLTHPLQKWYSSNFCIAVIFKNYADLKIMLPIYWWAILLILVSYVQIAFYRINKKTEVCSPWILWSCFSDILSNRAKIKIVTLDKTSYLSDTSILPLRYFSRVKWLQFKHFLSVLPELVRYDYLSTPTRTNFITLLWQNWTWGTSYKTAKNNDSFFWHMKNGFHSWPE